MICEICMCIHVMAENRCLQPIPGIFARKPFPLFTSSHLFIFNPNSRQAFTFIFKHCKLFCENTKLTDEGSGEVASENNILFAQGHFVYI